VERGSRQQRRQLEQVVAALSAGATLTESIHATGNYFPPLFRQMIEVGELTGQLDRTYQRLTQHYDRTLAARRAFLSQLAWPAFQLGIALLVIGLLIWIMGMLPRQGGAPALDLLGWGWIGTSGLIKYANLLIVSALVVLAVLESFRRGAAWVQPIQQAALRLPGVGHALKTLALARFTWAFQLVLGTSMDLRKALPLVLGATGNAYYARFGPQVALRIEQGQDVHTALTETGVFPKELLDAIAVGEESGRLAEVLERLAVEYQQRAAKAVATLAQVVGYLIWILVAVLIISIIFQLFSSYVGVINEAAKPI
jgi:type II secretory pathway component PulF